MTYRLAICSAVVFAVAAAQLGCDEEMAAADDMVDAEAEVVLLPRTCEPPAVTDGRPTSIAAMVDHLNALPQPITVPCFLESLARPLDVAATWNTFSAQPALSPADPRIFIFIEGLAISVVTKGEGRPLVEFSERTTPERSIKAELAFPIDGPLDSAAPFADIGDRFGSECAFCHLGSTRVESITDAWAYESEYIPGEARYAVELRYLESVWDLCDRAGDADRCAMFDALFGHGELRPGSF